MFDRWYATEMQAKLSRPYVHLLLGARQTGKSTLLNGMIPAEALRFNLADPQERSRHLARPGEFAQACRSLPAGKKGQFVFVDEAQSVPSIFDAVQMLYDADKTRWRFVLCGSSARQLRLTGANLLPGRSLVHHLYPLTLTEYPAKETNNPHVTSPLPFPWHDEKTSRQPFPAASLLTRLAYGALPGIVTADQQDRTGLLKAYAFVHLEEEIRREALVKDWGGFLRFLQLAAIESGQLLNYTNLSKETGISQPTIKSHYQLLEDMFVGIRVPAYSKSPRKNLLSTPKFIFFDLGVRHAAAGLVPSVDMVKTNPGPIFEQWVGIELWQRLQYAGTGKLHHQRSHDGAEVDFIIEHQEQLTPIEVKWTENPTLNDCRHLLSFLQEQKKNASHGFVICRCPRPLQLHENITALPWHCL